MYNLKPLFFLVLFLSHYPVHHLGSELTPVVFTSEGPVIGTTQYFDGIKVYSYLGIPFAKPPVENLRFRKPQIPPVRSVLYEATKPGPGCIQAIPTTVSAAIEMREDCLYLNVLLRKEAIEEIPLGKLRPVIVFIVGGGFNFDEADHTPYLDPVLVATQDIILVNFDYRIEIYGFIYHSSFPKQFIGNLGFFDQNMAIRWVKKNIKKFGGDPDNITIWGQSAGAIAVSVHLVSPFARNLFKRAIISSGQAVGTQIMPNLRTTLTTQEVLDRSGCSSVLDKLSCLQRLNATYLSSIIPAKVLPFLPVYNSEYLPLGPEEYMNSSKYPPMDVDVLMGITAQDGSVFDLIGYPEMILNQNLTLRDAANHIQLIYQAPLVPNVFMWYIPNSPFVTSDQIRFALIRIMTDIFSGCSSWEQSRRHLEYQKKGKTFAYTVTQKPGVSFFPFCTPQLGVCHGDDLIYSFGVPFTRKELYSDTERELSYEIMSGWASFARTG